MDSRMRISAVRSHRRLQNSTWEPRDPSAHAAVATRNILKGRAPVSIKSIGYALGSHNFPRGGIVSYRCGIEEKLQTLMLQRFSLCLCSQLEF